LATGPLRDHPVGHPGIEGEALQRKAAYLGHFLQRLGFSRPLRAVQFVQGDDAALGDQGQQVRQGDLVLALYFGVAMVLVTAMRRLERRLSFWRQPGARA
jgi:hypothetical protein